MASPRDHLYERLFQPWALPEAEWPLAREDWQRVEAVCALPWQGRVLDIGSGDGTLGALVASRNPLVTQLWGVEPDPDQVAQADRLWHGWPASWGSSWPPDVMPRFDGALVAEVLEHLTPEDGLSLLRRVKAACRPGALVVVTVPNVGGSRADYPGHLRWFSSVDLDQLLQEAGFPLAAHSTIAATNPIWLMAVCHA